MSNTQAPTPLSPPAAGRFPATPQPPQQPQPQQPQQITEKRKHVVDLSSLSLQILLQIYRYFAFSMSIISLAEF